MSASRIPTIIASGPPWSVSFMRSLIEIDVPCSVCGVGRSIEFVFRDDHPESPIRSFYRCRICAEVNVVREIVMNDSSSVFISYRDYLKVRDSFKEWE